MVGNTTNTSRVGTSSADVVVRHEVVAAATAHTKLKTASSTDHVEDLHVLKRAVIWLHPVSASTALLAKLPRMDWSAGSSPPSVSCREPGSMITGSTAAIGAASESGQFGPIGLEV